MLISTRYLPNELLFKICEYKLERWEGSFEISDEFEPLLPPRLPFLDPILFVNKRFSNVGTRLAFEMTHIRIQDFRGCSVEFLTQIGAKNRGLLRNTNFLIVTRRAMRRLVRSQLLADVKPITNQLSRSSDEGSVRDDHLLQGR